MFTSRAGTVTVLIPRSPPLGDEVRELADPRLCYGAILVAGFRVFLDTVLGLDACQERSQQRRLVLAHVNLHDGRGIDGLDPAQDIEQRPSALRSAKQPSTAARISARPRGSIKAPASSSWPCRSK